MISIATLNSAVFITLLGRVLNSVFGWTPFIGIKEGFNRTIKSFSNKVVNNE